MKLYIEHTCGRRTDTGFYFAGLRDVQAYLSEHGLAAVPLEDTSIPRSGLIDKNGREICLGDTIELHIPTRSSQTHYGERIPHPSGQYTEPLEPEITTDRYLVQWDQGMFHLGTGAAFDEEGGLLEPMAWCLREYKDREQLIDAFGGFDRLWIDKHYPGEDDLGYLLDQYPPNTEEELMLYLSGCEVVEPEKIALK